MKKLLLATSALVASAGFAMADGHISMSGSAAAGFYDEGFGDGVQVYNGATMTFSLSGASDNGLEFGSSITLDAWDREIDPGDFEVDNIGDFDVSGGTVWISSGGFKITFDHDGIDDLEDDDNAHDIQIDYSAGDLSLSLTNDVDGDNGGSEMSFSAAYNAGDLGLSLSGNDDDQMTVGLTYALGDVDLGIEHSDDMGVADTTLSAGFSAGDVSVSAEVTSGDSPDSWELGVGFGAGNIDVSATIAGADGADETWELTGSMDAGGGLTLHGGVNSADFMFLGAAMSF